MFAYLIMKYYICDMENNKLNYVAYYRVSTQQQGRSGLGLEAQQREVLSFVKDNNLVAEYTDIESGRKDKRQQLALAIDHAKRTNSTLLIAKLDRLSRNVSFIANLMESKVSFKCCDMPLADEFTINIFAALAQHERKMISERTRAALKSAKARGVKLGNPRADKAFMDKIRVQRQPITVSPQVAFIINQLIDKSLPTIAAELNKQGLRTTRGHDFTPVQVFRLKKRLNSIGTM